MRRALLLSSLVVVACGHARGPDASPQAAARSLPVTSAAASPSDDKSLNGAHFDVVWKSGAASLEDGQRVLDRGERARAKLVELLGEQRVGDRRIRIRLGGDGGRDKIPYVDPDTRDIVLYRFPGEGGAYEAPLAHELVHAIRFDIWTKPERQTDPALFWEEGFAELLAREAGFPSTGFPLFGVDPYVAAA